MRLRQYRLFSSFAKAKRRRKGLRWPKTSATDKAFRSLMELGIEANQVVALRLMKLMMGGKESRREAQLMVSEKIDAAIKAGASTLAGASGDTIIRQYRRRVAANKKRLSTERKRKRRYRSGGGG